MDVPKEKTAEDKPNGKITEEKLGEQMNGGLPSISQNDALKMNDGNSKEASPEERVDIPEVNDEDTGLAARIELDDAETKRELAGL
jgi:hypothetical protein